LDAGLDDVSSARDAQSILSILSRFHSDAATLASTFAPRRIASVEAYESRTMASNLIFHVVFHVVFRGAYPFARFTFRRVASVPAPFLNRKQRRKKDSH